jgi:hypothetical protein
MIVKGERVRAGRAAGPLIDHLLRGEDNDLVTLVQGTEEDIRSAFGDARALDRQFALRHFIVSPAVETSRDEALMVVGLLAREFGFNPTSAIVVEHTKPRAVASAFQTHWHALVPEQDAVTGRTLSSSHSYLRNVKVARVAEGRLGHPLVACPHATAVIDALIADGELELANAVRRASEAQHRPREGFSRGVHKQGKRLGVDVPAARAAVRAAWETTATGAEFTGALEASGLHIRIGDKRGTLIVETADGVFIGAAHRLARVRRADIEQRMKGAENDRNRPANPTGECQSVPGPVAQRDHGDEPPLDPARPELRRQGAGRAGVDPAGIHPHGDPGHSDERRGAPSKARCGRTLRARRGARDLAHALRLNPTRAGRLCSQAAILARPPAARVDDHLSNLERRLEARLEQRLSPPALSQSVLDARAGASALEDFVRGWNEQLRDAERAVATLNDGAPAGLRARLDGRREAWKNNLASALARRDVVRKQRDATEAAALRARTNADNLARAQQQAQNRLIRTAENMQATERLRRRVAVVQLARRHLQACPALGWGGLAMVFAAVTALRAARGGLEEAELGLVPSLPTDTDLWGVGRLPRPTC